MKKINLLVSTFFGCGYLTRIPGTITSGLTTFFIYIIYEILKYTDLKLSIIFFSILFVYSFYAVKNVENDFENKDPRQIVIDEVLGQSIPLIFLLFLNKYDQINISIEIFYFLSFIFFRFFDILKPFPISYFDKNYKNYFGIIMDDIMAGLYTIILIYLISLNF